MRDTVVSGCGTAIYCNLRGSEAIPVELRMCILSLRAQQVSSQAQNAKSSFGNEKARRWPGFWRVQVLRA
jgi:hypothetical protein